MQQKLTVNQALEHALTLFQAGNYDDSRVVLNKLIEVVPAHPIVNSSLAVVEYLLGNNALSEKYFKQSLAANPNDENTLKNLTVLYYKSGKLDEAKKIIDHRIALNANDLDTIIELSEYYRDKQDLANCAGVLTDAMNRPGISPEIMFRLGAPLCIALWSLGDFEQCTLRVRQLLSLGDPESLSGKDRVSFLFFDYIKHLISHYHSHRSDYNKPYNEQLFVIGESHSLSPAHLCLEFNNTVLRVIPKYVRGCKVWHLARAEMNEYKRAFKEAVSSIPDNAKK